MHAHSIPHRQHRRPAPRRCRELAVELRAIFEDAIDGCRISLAGVLSLEYEEVRGSKVRALQSLFDTSRVPADGFSPPKFATAYDTAFTQDWTGDSERDLIGNRTKRFFLDSPRSHVRLEWTSGSHYPRTGSAARTSSVTGPVYARHRPQRVPCCTKPTWDTGAVLTTLSVPLFVKRERFGIVTVGWDPERLRD